MRPHSAGENPSVSENLGAARGLAQSDVATGDSAGGVGLDVAGGGGVGSSSPARSLTRGEMFARVCFALTAVLCLGGNLISFYIGSWKDSGLDPTAGYSTVFEAGWEHMLNQPAYFTFMSNFLVGITSLLLALRLHRSSELFHAVRIAGLICIVITGVVFNVLLRGEETLVGIELFNDRLQHITTPILAPLLWLLLGPRWTVTGRRVGLAAAIPLVWLAYTLGRGPLVDWYPYSILDVPLLGYDGVAVYVVSILAFFFAVGAVMWLADRGLGRAGVGIGSRPVPRARPGPSQ